MKSIRRPLMPAVAIGVMTAIMVAPAPASAATSDDPPPVPNGCSFVPDSGPTFDFKEMCDQHDACYFDHAYTSKTRKQCDVEFKNAMYDHCDERHSRRSFSRRICRSVGWVYYAGVRVLGGLSWSEFDEPIGADPVVGDPRLA